MPINTDILWFEITNLWEWSSGSSSAVQSGPEVYSPAFYLFIWLTFSLLVRNLEMILRSKVIWSKMPFLIRIFSAGGEGSGGKILWVSVSMVIDKILAKSDDTLLSYFWMYLSRNNMATLRFRFLSMTVVRMEESREYGNFGLLGILFCYFLTIFLFQWIWAPASVCTSVLPFWLCSNCWSSFSITTALPRLRTVQPSPQFRRAHRVFTVFPRPLP